MRDLTSIFFHEGLQNNIKDRKKNKEGHWENCVLYLAVEDFTQSVTQSTLKWFKVNLYAQFVARLASKPQTAS